MADLTAVAAPESAATSPYGARPPMESPAAGLRELPWCGKINIRGDPANAKFMRATQDLHLPLPLLANTTAHCEAGTIFWLGPDEWLLRCDLAATEPLLQRLAQRLASTHHAVTEVTDYYAVFELAGENAAAILARGCPLDLHARQFHPPQCAQTRFGHASILLHKPTATVFEIQTRWSFADYVWCYLTAASAML